MADGTWTGRGTRREPFKFAPDPEPRWVETERADIPDGARVQMTIEGNWSGHPYLSTIDFPRTITYRVWTEGTPNG